MNTNNEDQNSTLKSEEVEKLEFRSEEVNEILTSVPHWMVRSGSVYLLLLIIMALVISWFVRYPMVIGAPITITTQVPPATLISQTQGYLHLWVKEKETVSEGQVLGYLKNSCDVNTALSIRKLLDSAKTRFYTDPGFVAAYQPANRQNLGELQSWYNSFASKVQQYQNLIKIKEHLRRTEAVRREIHNYNTLTQQQRQQVDLMSQQLDLAHKLFARDSGLYMEKVISKAEYEQKEKEYIANIGSYKSAISNITNTDIQKTQLSNRLKEISLDEEHQVNDLLLSIEASVNDLDAHLKQWEQQYLFRSPVKGRVALFNFWADNQYIKASEEILTVVPDNNNFVVLAQVPVVGSGKIKLGQKVKIKLDNFPYQEYGVLEGRVQNISILPREKKYSIRISLPKGLKSSYNQFLDFKQDMTGTGEIITEDLRLVERVFYSFRQLIGR